VAVRLNSAALKGNALNLDMDIKIAQMQIGRYESVSLRLVLRGTGKGQTLLLPPVIVNGANKRNMFERAVALHGSTAAKNGAYAVLKNDPELIQYLSYKRAVTYNSWMNNCQLLLVGELKDYNNNTLQSFTTIVSRKLSVRRSTTIPTATTRQPSASPSGSGRTSPATRPAATSTTRPAATSGARQPAATPTTRQRTATRPTTSSSPAGRQGSTAPATRRTTSAPAANRQNNNKK
jgi:hypothetical protein